MQITVITLNNKILSGCAALRPDTADGPAVRESRTQGWGWLSPPYLRWLVRKARGFDGQHSGGEAGSSSSCHSKEGVSHLNGTPDLYPEAAFWGFPAA